MNAQFSMILLAVIMIGFSIYSGLKVMSIYRRKSASEEWPVVPGTVLARDVSSVRNTNGRGHSYRAEVTYRYATPGGPFEKKLFVGSKGVRAQADKLLESMGDSIQVRYNPQNPSEHISDQEKVMPAQVAAAVGALLLAVVLLVLALL